MRQKFNSISKQKYQFEKVIQFKSKKNIILKNDPQV